MIPQVPDIVTQLGAIIAVFIVVDYVAFQGCEIKKYVIKDYFSKNFYWGKKNS